MSNYYVLTYIDNDKNLHAINLSEESVTNFSQFFLKNLKNNMKKLYYSNINRDYYKLLKRLWSYGRFTNNQTLINKLLPIINSIVALGGQLRSEFNVLINLIEHIGYGYIPHRVFNNQLGNIKFKIASLLKLGENNIEMINQNIDSIIHNNYNDNIIIEKLKSIKDILNNFVQKESYKYIKENGLDKYIN